MYKNAQTNICLILLCPLQMLVGRMVKQKQLGDQAHKEVDLFQKRPSLIFKQMHIQRRLYFHA